MKSDSFHIGQKFHHTFGLLLIETMSPRTFKNRHTAGIPSALILVGEYK